MSNEILITRTSRKPSVADVRLFTSRFFSGDVPDSAIHQLIKVSTAANRWLKDHPEDAPRLIVDPAAVLQAMKDAGVVKDEVGDLLAVLQSLRRDSAGKLTARARLVNFLRPSSARFGRKPVLRVAARDNDSDENDEADTRGGR